MTAKSVVLNTLFGSQFSHFFRSSKAEIGFTELIASSSPKESHSFPDLL
ncbi:hypothetical protein [Pediococcus parvulus]